MPPMLHLGGLINVRGIMDLGTNVRQVLSDATGHGDFGILGTMSITNEEARVNRCAMMSLYQQWSPGREIDGSHAR
jgi:hypothetical protein